MELFKLNRIIATLAFGASLVTFPAIANASSDKYNCREVRGVYGVYSRVPRGDIRLMEFNRDVNDKWSISNRCEEVAIRFQRYYDNGILRDIGAGYLNNQPVLCAIVEKDTPCSNENIIVTLPANTDPISYARQLMDIRGLARGRVIAVSGDEKIEVTSKNGNTYYSLEALENAVLEQENSDRLIPIDD